MMTNDDKAAATKQDIQLLMEQMATYYDKTGERMQEIIGEFHIVVGRLRHDFKGAFGDKLAQHEDRIVRLKRNAGLLAA